MTGGGWPRITARQPHGGLPLQILHVGRTVCEAQGDMREGGEGRYLCVMGGEFLIN